MAVTPSSPVFRYVRGIDSFSVLAPASTMINIGDLLWSNSSVAGCASAFTWNTNLATTQTGFRDLFLGVSNDSRLVTDASSNKQITVLTHGVFTFPCVALGSAAQVGAFVAPAQDTGTNLLDQVLAIATQATGIGVLVAPAAVGATSLTVYLKSFLLEGGFAL